MPLTRDFRETVMVRFEADPAFRSELIIEAINAFLMDEMETGKALLRDYLNATGSNSKWLVSHDTAKKPQIT